MSAKITTPDLLKTRVFWNIGYGFIILTMMLPIKFDHVIQMILYIWSPDQSLVTAAFLWVKLSQPQFYKDLTKKIAFFKRWSWFKLNNFRLALGRNLNFCTSVAKGSKLNSQMFRGSNITFVQITGEKLVGGPFWPPAPSPE